MSRRTDRLTKVLVLQEKLKELHETRQAMHAANAHFAAREAEDVVEAFNAEGSLSSVFPEVYHARIAAATAAKQQHLANAHVEGLRVAKASARVDAVGRAVTVSRRADERFAEERDQTEALSRQPAKPK
jgi:hypothetical protein